jgi:predicted PurR-regulated permease PerM
MMPIQKRPFSVLEIFQILVLTTLILYFGKTLFIPLSFSLLISFILYPICKWLEKKGINKGLAISISFSILSLFLASVFYLMLTQVITFSEEWHILRDKLSETGSQVSGYINDKFDISFEKQSEYLKNTINNSGSQTFSLIKNTAYSFSESFYFLLMIPIFSMLLLYHRQLFANALYQLFPAEKKGIIQEILIETIQEYYNFIKGMLTVYLIVGILNSIGLAVIGVPHPILFGFIASILTFIPYVGIMISSLLPITLSWITFNSIWYPIGVIIVFTIVQILEAYIIFPFAVGNRLKINTFVILIIVIIGGIIWGAAGMILFIPFTSIAKLIADRTASLKTLSLLLSDGNLKEKQS